MSDLITIKHKANPEAVNKMFGSIAGTYDKANDFLTFGLAHSWRKKLVKWSEVKPGQKILDCATGTGDLAFEFKKTVGGSGQVVGSDFCHEMLEIGKLKAQKNSTDIQFEWGDASQLNYTDNFFNITSIAYGIRNVGEPVKAIKEMARVTSPGGHVMILETGEPRLGPLNKLLHLYFKWIVPFVGGLISGQKSAYQYLNQSTNGFPARQDFVKILEETNKFSTVEYKSLMGGASYIYKATVK